MEPAISQPTSIVRSIEDDQPVQTEEQIVAAAAAAVRTVEDCYWRVGELAFLWTDRFSRDRGDAEFAELVGMSTEMIYQRRRVWETFGDVKNEYAFVSPSHFYTALTWGNAEECLAWANENGRTLPNGTRKAASLDEMRAYWRMGNGEDLTKPAENDHFETTGSSVESDVDDVDGDATTDGTTPKDGAGRDAGTTDEQDGSGPENESPVAQDGDTAHAPSRGDSSPGRTASRRMGDDVASNWASADEPERITKAPGDKRPKRVDAAAESFRRSCESLRNNLRQFVGAATDREQRAELEAVLVSALEEIRNA